MTDPRDVVRDLYDRLSKGDAPGALADRAPKPAFGVDLHSTYMHAWLNQAGVSKIDEIRFQPTLLTQDPAGDFQRAKQAAVDLAGTNGSV